MNIKALIWGYFLWCTTFLCYGFSWGFFGHRHINELAVFTLPRPMIGFYKEYIEYIIDYSVDPDRRRYVIEDEAPRHYIDLDLYGDSASIQGIPIYWNEAVACFGEDTLMARGVVPWQVYRMYSRLKRSFLLRSPEKILHTAAELGHYIADANVPLHTTSNYNGQLTGQAGIHAFWESRLPELFFSSYDFFVGRAHYVADVQSYVWRAVRKAHSAVDSVLSLEKQLAKRLGEEKYSFETRGKKTVKVISKPYATQYHNMLHGMVERQMRSSVKMIGDLWYTAWVAAGQPDLDMLIRYRPTKKELMEREKELAQWHIKTIKTRDH